MMNFIIFVSLMTVNSFVNGLSIRNSNSRSGRSNDIPFIQEEYDTFLQYNTYEQILDYLWRRNGQCGSRCQLVTIGHSYEGRPLQLIKVTSGDMRKKRGVFIDAGIHAREWISHITAMYIIEMLTCNYDCDEQAPAMLEEYDWYILPVLNPDGYVYTWTSDRDWRKSRHPVLGAPDGCVGVDMNRNFDHMWAKVSDDPDPCSETFAGVEPMSEPETQALGRFILENHGNWILYLTLHSKGQLIMAPWGYTTNLTEDYYNLALAGEAAVNAIKDTSGETYQFGTSANILYTSSGTSRDWAKGVAGIPYSYTIELRPNNSDDWTLDEKFIIPVGQEIWAGVKAMVNNLMPF